jgi:hypothetical protein
MSCGTGLTGGDLTALTACSLTDCMEACSTLNYYQGPKTCVQLEYHSMLNVDGGAQWINWLKNASATTNQPYSLPNMQQYAAAAYLDTS